MKATSTVSAVKLPVQGNVAKYHGYRVAWERIHAAIEGGFFVEAIAIQESIMSDRLLGHLTRHGARVPSPNPSFHQVLVAWRALAEDRAHHGFDDLCRTILEEWKPLRNEAVHAIVKVGSTSGPADVDAFLARSAQAARFGAKLARAVQGWTRKHATKT